MVIDTEIVTKQLNIKELVLDKNVQMRATINRAAVVDYSDEMEKGAQFPPIIVYHKVGSPKYVADGFHRVLACRRLGVKTVLAEVRFGGKREAMLYAAGANSHHGVRRTNEDKRKAVLALLSDREWRNWTDTAIAEKCAVGPTMVSRYRGYMGEEASPTPDKDGLRRRKYIDRNGHVRERVVADADQDKQEERMERVIRGEYCPYCHQKMPGQSHRIR